jgi:hypothetical protein
MNKLLLTSTIDVGNCFNLNRKDFNTRLLDYKKTLNRYLKETDLKLIFIDNSIESVKELFNDICDVFDNRIEFISYKGNSNVNIYGKGHGERDSIIYALNNSTLLKNESFFYKISGRYYSPDIYHFIKTIDTNKFLSVNSLKHNENNILTVFFGCNIQKFKCFFSDLKISDNSNIIEKAFSNFVDTIPTENVFWLPQLTYEDTMCSNNIPFLKG